MEKVILTGDRPTGRLHIGHYVGSLRRRVELQNSGEYDKIFIMIADAQALTDNADNPEKIRQNVIEVALDYLAAGIDPEKTNIFIQSAVPELTELSFYYMNLVSVQRLQRNPTVKSELEMRKFEGGTPTGFFCYPISQAADITLFKATTVPVGEDQKPMLEQTNEIVRRFNHIYGNVLIEPKILLPDNQACMRLPGTDGKAKMSKSLGNCIYLSDSAKELKKKVNSMFTDPQHLTIDSPGHLEGNTVFTYLDAFCKDEDFERFLPDYKNLDEMKAHYCRGGLVGTGDWASTTMYPLTKNAEGIYVGSVLNDRLEPIRERRHEWEQRIPEVVEILRKGTEAARERGVKTLAEVRHAMRIDYFEDPEFIKEQASKFI